MNFFTKRKEEGILIIGGGTVGYATGKSLKKKGYKIVFIEKDTNVVKKLREEGFETYFPQEIKKISEEFSVSIFCIGTPSKRDGSINLRYLINALITHGKWLRNKKGEYHLIVIKSTILPGTSRSILIPLLEQYSGKHIGRECGFCVQPEFLRAKSAEQDALYPWAIVIGEIDRRSGRKLLQIYSDFKCKKFRVDLETAEFIKYVHNCFNATKISFANEMWLLGQKLGIPANKALEIVVNTAEGFWNPYYGTIGGRPFGGACLPKDTKALQVFAKKVKLKMPLLSAVISVNKKMNKLAKRGIVPPATSVGLMWKPSPILNKNQKFSDIKKKGHLEIKNLEPSN